MYIYIYFASLLHFSKFFQVKTNSLPDPSVCPLQDHCLFSPMFMLKDASEPFSNC